MSDTGRTAAYMIAARRTPVAPRGGALAIFQADELAASVLKRVLEDVRMSPLSVDQVILGNALYGGGNPARLAALRAGLPPQTPAMTVDTQCCSGLDAIITAAHLIESGAAECILAGGTESFSRAPIRMQRPLDKFAKPIPYKRPPFAPPPFDDPDLAEAAARLAAGREITRKEQAEFAIASHAKAVEAGGLQNQILVSPEDDILRDAFSRPLTLKTALRAPVITGDPDCGLTAATIACEADGAAGVLLVSERIWKQIGKPALRIVAGTSKGGEPSDPALVPIGVAAALFERLNLSAQDFSSVELMEAYAVQAIVTARDLDLVSGQLNRWGGALARGHPIGASGAILAVQLFGQVLRTQGNAGDTEKNLGLALIAAAGGLGSGLVVERAAYKYG